MSWIFRQLTIVVAMGAAACALPARGTPANKAAMERHLDRFLAKNLQSCTTCHLPSDVKEPESLDDFPHNGFGDALRKVGKQLKGEGKKRDIATRITLIGSQDSDGDGVDNLTELLLGHNPGDAKDVPTAEELKQAAGRREEFAAFLKSYRWQPFEPVTRPAVPQVGVASAAASSSSAAGNPIDAFVAK